MKLFASAVVLYFATCSKSLFEFAPLKTPKVSTSFSTSGFWSF
jgi:hypothetical protein